MQQSKQGRVIGMITLIVVIAILSTVFLKSRGILTESETSSAQIRKEKITIITSDVIADQSWGSLAYKGQLKIEESYPVDVSLYSEINTEALMISTVTDAIKDGSKLIIGHGREFSEVFTSMAREYSDIHFITIHGTSIYPNQTVYTFDQSEIEYFAGLAASLVTNSNKIGVIIPFDKVDRNGAFERGLLHYKPEAEVNYKVVGSRDDGAKAGMLMKELIEQGVDVIYSKGNAYNQEIINIAKKEKVYVIGYLDDQSYMGKEQVITSVLNDVPQVYVEIIKDYFSNHGLPSGKIVLNANHGVYSLAPFGPMLSKEDIQIIETEMAKYNRGELTFP